MPDANPIRLASEEAQSVRRRESEQRVQEMIDGLNEAATKSALAWQKHCRFVARMEAYFRRFDAGA